MRSGILPPPEEIAEYEKYCSGVTDRLLLSYEKQLNHRIDVENKLIDDEIKKGFRNQTWAGIITVLVLIFGFVLIFTGKNIQGFMFIGIEAIFVAGAFITGRFRSKKELKK